MVHSRRLQILFRVLFVILLLMTGLALVWLYLPTYAERRLIPGLLEDLDLGPLRVDIRHIGLRSLDLGDLVLGDPQRPAITADSLRADFTTGDLRRKRIRRLAVSGARINLRYTPRGLELEGLALPGAPQPDPHSPKKPSLPPFPLEELHISQSSLLLHRDDTILRIPLELNIQTDAAQPTRLNGRLRLFPWGRLIALTGRLEGNPVRLKLNFESDPLPLAPLAAYLGNPAGLNLQGEISLRGALTLDPMAYGLSAVQLHIGLKRLAGSWGDTALGLAPVAHPQGPWEVHVASPDGRSWRVDAPPLDLSGPWPLGLDLEELNRTATAQGPRWDLQAVLRPAWERIFNSAGMEPSEPIKSALALTAHYHENGTWQARLTEHKPVAINLVHGSGGLTMDLAAPAIRLDAQGSGNTAGVAYQLHIPHNDIHSPALQVRTGPLSLTGSLQWSAADPQQPLTANYRLSLDNPCITAGTTAIEIPRIETRGRALAGGRNPLLTQGALTFSGARISDPAQQIELTAVNGVLPYSWPMEKGLQSGTITVGQAAVQNINLGRTVLRVKPDTKGVGLQGKIDGALLPAMKGKIEGRLEPSNRGAWGGRVTAGLDLPVTTPADLGQWLPAGEGYTFQGRIQAGIKISLEGNPTKVGADLQITDGTLENRETGLKVTGMTTAIEIPDLGTLRSAPAQQLTFESLDMGRIHLDQCEFIFQVEPGITLFLEEGRMQWCEGRVFLGPTRIGDAPDVGVDLFCDRLKMAPLLAQIGDFEAAGQGSLNGRIPIRWEGGKLKFVDGFLYSSPGEEGSIRLTGTEILTAALPPGTPQANQVEVAREALKDYNYKWAKLELNSLGEDLQVRMKLDGQPAVNLPFVFDQEFGGFVRVGPDEAGSRFQGIRLDVNFSLPLNRLLDHYENIQHIFQPQ